VTPANALVFAPGDAVLVIHGNAQEGYVNLGSWNTIKVSGGVWDVSSILNTAGVSGGNTIRYVLVGNGGTNTPMWFGNNADISAWTSTQKNQLNVSAYNNALTNWAGQLGVAADPSRQIYSASDPLSFNTYFDVADSDTLAGTIPNGRRGASDIDQILYLLERTGVASTLAGVNTGILNSVAKTFTIGQVAPVPVPAAAVLFATGMVGLVGFARRSMGRLAS
jgi:hypothetical protein